MAGERSLFSESWHRVAKQKIKVRPSVTVHQQYFRGELWYVAHDSYGDQYFRFRPEAWKFISRLDGRNTVESVWKVCLDLEGDSAPGQGEVVNLLAQLYNANLIISDIPPDVMVLFERQKKRKASEWKAQIFGIFYFRIPLWDPDTFLNRTINGVKWLLTPFGAILWLLVAGSGLSLVFGNWDQATSQSSGIFDPSNLFLLYVAFAFTKFLHEMGHAYAVKRFNGEVHRMGITLLVFTPVPYVDATAAWAFRERWKRVWVGSAGMIVELFVAALAVWVWTYTGPGIINGLAYNVMIVASISTLLFNINPLLRFDGYYILSDLTDSPNLQGRSTQQWHYWIEKYAFGGPSAYSPSATKPDASWLSFFGIASWVYRIFITFTIIIFVADKFFGLGFLAAVLTLVGFIVLPLYKGIKYLLAEPRIESVRGRAIGVTVAFLALLFVLLGVIPFPDHFRAPGVIKATPSRYIISDASGYALNWNDSLRRVKDSDVILSMANPEMELELKTLKAEIGQVDAMERRSFQASPADLGPISERRNFIESKLTELREDQQNLEIRSPVAGELVIYRPQELVGKWIPRGTVLGEVIGEQGWEFRAVVSQEDASKLFGEEMSAMEIRFQGLAGKEFVSTEVSRVPSEQDFLPSPALGWAAGGPVRLADNDQTGMRAYEPFFLVAGELTEDADAFWHGRTGYARFKAPSKPLLHQWIEDLRQLLQRRFQL